MVVINKEKLKKRLILALDWISDIALKKEEEIDRNSELNILKAEHIYWKGAIRNEYIVSSKKWNFYAPVWHSGQALKSLIYATQLDFITNKDKYINAGKEIGDFIIKNQIWDKNNPDHGLILAFEDVPGIITTSGIMEAADGLFLLTNATNERIYQDRILECLNFCKNRLYNKGKGLFNDGYDYKNHKVKNPYNRDRNEGVVGRPLEDDSIFLKAWKLTGDENYKAIFWETLERLIKEENPPGNWIKYFPCNPMKGDIHPRHAFWWGRPFIRAYEETSDEKLKKKYLDVAIRAGEWYKKAIRKDGGLFRRTYIDFNTDSFGHATSGSACAAILWMELKNITKNKEYNSYIRNSINHCMQMQFVEPNLSDKNLLGCVLEKILPPNGSDKNPYYIRDLGTIFFIQAAVKYLKTFN